MQDAHPVGAGSELLVPDKVTDPDHENHDHMWVHSIEDIRQLIPLAEKVNVRILTKNVGNGFCIEPQRFAQYIDEFDRRGSAFTSISAITSCTVNRGNGYGRSAHASASSMSRIVLKAVARWH